LKATLLAAVAGLVLCGDATAQAKITLRVADHYSPEHLTAKYTIKFFMDRVKTLTNGQVDFQYYPAEQLGKAKDMLSLTQRGVIDIGLVAPAYVSEKMPLSAVAELPGTYAKSCQGNTAYWKLSRSGILAEKEFKPNGIRPLITLPDHDARQVRWDRRPFGPQAPFGRKRAGHHNPPTRGRSGSHGRA
jgi:TRAP-type C4-dicarboxylate transport system substrate-binding protein